MVDHPQSSLNLVEPLHPSILRVPCAPRERSRVVGEPGPECADQQQCCTEPLIAKMYALGDVPFERRTMQERVERVELFEVVIGQGRHEVVVRKREMKTWTRRST